MNFKGLLRFLVICFYIFKLEEQLFSREAFIPPSIYQLKVKNKNTVEYVQGSQ